MSKGVVVAGVLVALIGGAVGSIQAQGSRLAEDEKVINEQNLFAPSRSQPTPPPAPKAPPKPVAAPLPPPPPTPKFILSGVVLDGDTALALLQEPGLTQDQVRVVSPGAEVGSYRLTAVLQDRVELEGPSGKITVPLSGPSRPVARTATIAPGAPSRPTVLPPPGARAPAAGLVRPVPAVPPPPSEAPPEMAAPEAPRPPIQVPLDDPRRSEGFKALFDALRQGSESPEASSSRIP